MVQPGVSISAEPVIDGPYRVMIVDDSVVIRGFLTKWLEAEPDIEVVAHANNGVAALREFERHRPEIVILDIEMPEMDGMTALPKLMALDRDLQVIMASTLTRRNADVSLKALSNGAADYIAKPESTRDALDKDAFQRGLTEKVRALGATRRSRLRRRGVPVVAPAVTRPVAATPKAAPAVTAKKPIILRTAQTKLSPKVIAIGSSTGGPQALFKLFEDLKGKINLPILITQHMPGTFTAILAEHLNKIYDKECAEAVHGEKIQNGKVYIAPGDWHMTAVKKDDDVVIQLDQKPQENFCRPSVEPMLRSLLAVYAERVLTVILTGMGRDGADACAMLADAGAPLIGQDEKTSVVWGMPGAVATAGLCNKVLPLQEISRAMENTIMGRAS